MGDPLGPPRWTYEGEDFVAAVFEASCVRCGQKAFAREDCPACGAADGARRALGREPSLEVPDRCEACSHPELAVWVLVAVAQEHDGRSARKVVATSDWGEAGHQPTKVECVSCKAVVAQQPAGCAACGGVG